MDILLPKSEKTLRLRVVRTAPKELKILLLYMKDEGRITWIGDSRLSGGFDTYK